MTQAVLDALDVHAARHELRRLRVPEFVEVKAVEAALLGELGLPVREVCGLHEIALVGAADRRLVVLLLAEGCERLRLERLPLGEVLHRLAVEPELALAGLALGPLISP